MKKLLLLLLFLPLVSFGQNVQFGLDLVNQDTNAVVDAQNSIEEGETLRMEVHMSAVGIDDYTALADFKYIFLDIQYNHQILSPVTDCFDFPGIDALGDSGPLTSKYDFNSTSYSYSRQPRSSNQLE